MRQSTDMACIDLFSQRLSDFSNEIGNCIDKSDWEMLATILASRQDYLEQMLANPVSDEQRDAIRRLLENVLEEDAIFQSKVQDQKIQLNELQSVLERGRRAVQAYNNH